MTTEHLDEAAAVIRQLADEQLPEPLSEAELSQLLGGLPNVAAPRSRSWKWVTAAALLAVGLLNLPQRLDEPEFEQPVVVHAVQEPERIEIRMATSDPSINVVWVMSEDFEL
jgi:hypothetical protein